MVKCYLRWSDVLVLAEKMLKQINFNNTLSDQKVIRVYGVPRGGVLTALVLYSIDRVRIKLVQDVTEADIIVDDIVDTGETRSHYPSTQFYALINNHNKIKDTWYVFPWEATGGEEGVEMNVIRMLQFVGENPKRGGLIETPKRFSDALKFATSGYSKEPADILKTFKDGAGEYNELVMVKNIPFYSMCEHHLAPFFGTATVGYVPDGKIVGLSKINRLVDMYARRLQVQERMTQQIRDALAMHLKPRGVGVLVKARHLCMESRGICQQGHHTITSALGGTVFGEKGRAEFLKLAGE